MTYDSSVSLTKQRYQVDLNGKVFKVLISAIYADKIASICREIWSNALDAHQMAGKAEVPFQIVWPSLENPKFMVKDFGIGMSPSDVEEVYTSLFKSMKETNSFLVGKYGLGSKTPFAYTDTFTMISVYDHVKTYYNSVIAEDGVPNIFVLHKEVTTEGNGVTIEFPIQIGDIRAFQTAMRRVSLGFDVKPICVGGEKIDWPEIGKEIAKDFYECNAVSSLHFRMGPVLYPFDYDAFSKISQNEVVCEILNMLKHKSAVIDMPMDSIEISASRESLQYGSSDPTVYSIERKILAIKKELEAEVESATQLPYYVDAVSAFTKIHRKYGINAFVKNHEMHVATGFQMKIGKIPIDFGFFVSFGGGISRKKQIDKEVFLHHDYTTKDIVVVFQTLDNLDPTKGKQRVSDLARRVQEKYGDKFDDEGKLVQKAKKSFIVSVSNNKSAIFQIHRIMEMFDGCEIVWAGDVEYLEKKKTKKQTLTFDEKFGHVVRLDKNGNIDCCETFNSIKSTDTILILNKQNRQNRLGSKKRELEITSSSLIKSPKNYVIVTKHQAYLMRKTHNATDFDEYFENWTFDIEQELTPELHQKYVEWQSIQKFTGRSYFGELIRAIREKNKLSDIARKKFSAFLLSNEENELFTLIEQDDTSKHKNIDNVAVKRMLEDEYFRLLLRITKSVPWHVFQNIVMPEIDDISQKLNEISERI